jgi:hypothetical protein
MCRLVLLSHEVLDSNIYIYIYENNRWFNHGLDLIVNSVCFVLIHEEMGF